MMNPFIWRPGPIMIDRLTGEYPQWKLLSFFRDRTSFSVFSAAARLLIAGAAGCPRLFRIDYGIFSTPHCALNGHVSFARVLDLHLPFLIQAESYVRDRKTTRYYAAWGFDRPALGLRERVFLSDGFLSFSGATSSEQCGTHQLLAVHVVRPYLPLSFRAGQWQGTGRQWPRRAERNGFEEMRIQSLDA